MRQSPWQLILASTSPRRRELLSSVGLEFDVSAPNVDERIVQNEPAERYVQRLAQSKAHAVWQQVSSRSAVVLSADTTVVAQNQILEKPLDFIDAVRMWSLLSGKQHKVLTGICLHSEDQTDVRVVATQVTMTTISKAAMQDYWDSGEPQDKAGAYAIQGLASAWVCAVEGSFSNVVGLPLYETNTLLRPYGLHWL